MNCGAGLHFECLSILNGNCCCKNEAVEENEEEYEEETRQTGRKWSRDSTLKDQQSTGRKRAAVMYPLDEMAVCEWAKCKFAGGGKHPIIGCPGNLQKARHHGPDKNTLNNEKGNVHRICVHCHNRWHTKNDPDYDPENIGKAHDPDTKATFDEIAHNEVYWISNKPKKAGKD